MSAFFQSASSANSVAASKAEGMFCKNSFKSDQPRKKYPAFARDVSVGEKLQREQQRQHENAERQREIVKALAAHQFQQRCRKSGGKQLRRAEGECENG